MFNKLTEIQSIADDSNPAIISITETWLGESHTNDEVIVNGYKLTRRDRDSHAGGVCMYIRDGLSFNVREDLQNIALEDLWIELLFPKTKPIIVGTCYRAPENSAAKDCIEATLNKLTPEYDTILLGDFNYCLLDNKVNKFSEMMTTHGFSQIINKPTRVTNKSSSLIDHIYTNNTDKISQTGVIESGISDHFITYCTRKKIKDLVGKHTTVKIRPMKNYSEDIFIENLNGKEWNRVIEEKEDSGIALEIFNTMFIKSIDEICPEKEIRIKGRTKSWIDIEILEAMRERDKALYKSNHNKDNPELRAKFNRLRNNVTKLIKKTKSNHFCNKVEEHKNNPKMLWKQFKSLGYSTKSKDKSRIILEIDNEKCFDPIKVAREFAKYFLTVAENLVKKIPNILKIFDVDSQKFKDYYKDKGITPKSFKISQISEYFVLKELRKLNPTKSCGIDGIKPRFLKDGANIISSAITHIINLSIATETVPDLLKQAIVKPLYKKGSKLEVGNYRPVSLLCIISKILEKAVYVQLEKYLIDNNLLYDYQSGFRKSYSTDTCLINLMDTIKMENAQGLYAGMVLLDLQKAFDTVDHDILCKKLESMGIDFTCWFKSYLKGRTQLVIANETSSEAGMVTCGVPQGSILGPLLFLCYVNDMPMSIKCKLLLYADDSALIISGTDPTQIAEKLTKELESCQQWLMDNKLSLHLGKTEAMIFGTKRKLKQVESFEVKCGNIKINNVNQVKYLGLQIDDNLSGENAVKNVLKKANSRLKFLYRYSDMLKFPARKTLCSALIQCHFDYSCSSWYPSINKNLKDKLQIAQNKMIRFILNLNNRAHIGQNELDKAGFLKVSKRVTQLKLGQVFKINNKTCPLYLTQHFNRLNEGDERIATRGKAYNFHIPRINTNTFAYTAIKDWNSLPSRIKEIKSENLFKEKIKRHLVELSNKEERDDYI